MANIKKKDPFLSLTRDKQQRLVNFFRRRLVALKAILESQPENAGKTITYREAWKEYMNYCKDRSALLKRLKLMSRCASLKLPDYIDFGKSEPDYSVIRMHVGTRKAKGKELECVTDNMQQDSAAFEGWALAIKTRLPEVKKIELSWTTPSDKHNRHYQRFLYRVFKFEECFSEWFHVAQQFRDHMRIDFKSGLNYTLNVPSRARDRGESTGNRERAVEQRFVQKGLLNESLCEIASVEVLGNQLPVGLFEGAVSGKPGKAIFTGRASALDLWGVDKQRKVLSIFELKLAENRKIGVLSELFFYAMVMRDLVDGRFRFSDKKVKGVNPWPSEYITKGIHSIKAYILSPTLHPLINRSVLEAMTKKTTKIGVAFGHISYDLKKGKCLHPLEAPEVCG